LLSHRKVIHTQSRQNLIKIISDEIDRGFYIGKQVAAKIISSRRDKYNL
jgi:hypothetical protein